MLSVFYGSRPCATCVVSPPAREHTYYATEPRASERLDTWYNLLTKASFELTGSYCYLWKKGRSPLHRNSERPTNLLASTLQLQPYIRFRGAPATTQCTLATPDLLIPIALGIICLTVLQHCFCLDNLSNSQSQPMVLRRSFQRTVVTGNSLEM